MCGIFGLIRNDREEIPPQTLFAMSRSLAHRGPDQRGLYREPGVALGIERLAVVDVGNGSQPIFSEDRTLVIVYNGEIYNHAQLRKELSARGHLFRTGSDTETVLHAFEEYGAGCLTRLNGMFAFAIWDLSRKRLFLARDRLGIKPLYLAIHPDGLAFASEAKALLGIFFAGQPDWTSLYRYFSFGYVPSPQSPFSGIEKLPPGHFGMLENGVWKTQEYWKPSFGNATPRSALRARDEVEELLDHAVRLELMSDVPAGLFLSGGLDSSAVAFFAQRHCPKRLRSFALKFEERTHDESADARLVADHLGLDHTEVPCSADLLREALPRVAAILDEPFGDCTVLPLLILSEAARREVKVVLTGWGGDEIFAGYPTYRAHRLAQWYRKLPSPLSLRLIPFLASKLPVSNRYLSFEFKAKRFVKGSALAPELQHFLWMGYHDDAMKKRLFRSRILDEVREETFASVAHTSESLSGEEPVDRILELDLRYFLEGNGLFQADRITMAASLEARVPLLNNDLMQYVNALPSTLKMPGGEPKGLMKRVLRPHLPPRILKKPKKGFGPPCSAWINGVFRDLFDQRFSRERVDAEGIFNHGELSRLLVEHRDRRADHGRNLWAVLSFQLWWENFVAREPL